MDISYLYGRLVEFGEDAADARRGRGPPPAPGVPFYVILLLPGEGMPRQDGRRPSAARALCTWIVSFRYPWVAATIYFTSSCLPVSRVNRIQQNGRLTTPFCTITPGALPAVPPRLPAGTPCRHAAGGGWLMPHPGGPLRESSQKKFGTYLRGCSSYTTRLTTSLSVLYISDCTHNHVGRKESQPRGARRHAAHRHRHLRPRPRRHGARMGPRRRELAPPPAPRPRQVHPASRADEAHHGCESGVPARGRGNSPRPPYSPPRSWPC